MIDPKDYPFPIEAIHVLIHLSGKSSITTEELHILAHAVANYMDLRRHLFKDENWERNYDH